MDLADRIRICRENANLTQKELAAQLQLPADIILQWEQGLLQPPVQILPQLLACLHVSLEELVPQEPAYAPQTAYSAPPTPKRKALSLRAIRIWKAVGLILFIANFFTIFAALSTVGAYPPAITCLWKTCGRSSCLRRSPWLPSWWGSCCCAGGWPV